MAWLWTSKFPNPNFPFDIFFPTQWTHACSKENEFQRWPVCPQWTFPTPWPGNINMWVQLPPSRTLFLRPWLWAAQGQCQEEEWSWVVGWRCWGQGRGSPQPALLPGSGLTAWTGSLPLSPTSIPPSAGIRCCSAQSCICLPQPSSIRRTSVMGKLIIELHTWLAPQQSCLLRIVADPRMFSWKTDFSDRLSKHFPCTISNMMGQNYAKHMGLTLPSATRGSLSLVSMAHSIHTSWVGEETSSCSVFFHVPSGREKARLMTCISACLPICHQLPLTGGTCW